MYRQFCFCAVAITALLAAATGARAQVPTPPPIHPTLNPWSASHIPKPPYAIITYPPASAGGSPTSVITPGAGNSFAVVGLEPDQIVQVTVQYPSNLALHPLLIEAADGGAIIPVPTAAVPISSPPPTPTVSPLPSAPPLPSPCQGCGQFGPSSSASSSVATSILPTDTNATLTFTYIAAHDPGTNRVILRELTPGTDDDGLPGMVVGNALQLQFWVIDAANPDTSPDAMITATNPEF